MRWPWQPKAETRASVGGYTEIISRLIEAQAVGSTQQASATSAIEAAAGALSRAFASATVEADPDISEAIDPVCLGLIGRDLIRVGESLHVLRMSGGRVRLVPCPTWYWEGGVDRDGWLCTATAYGPSGSTTWRVPESSVVFVRWGVPTARPYHGLGPSQWAADSARLHSNSERSLAEETEAAVAKILPVPQDGGDGTDSDPLAGLKTDIGAAKGKTIMLETTAGGWQEGRTAAPQSDWKQMRLGPEPTEAQVKLSDSAFARMLSACGTPPSIFAADADGTAQREGLRRYHLGTVLPLARILEHELTRKLGVPVRLKFDNYPLDLDGRAKSFKAFVSQGMEIDRALSLTGLLADGD